MRCLLQEVECVLTPTELAELLTAQHPGVCLIRSAAPPDTQPRYTFVTAEPFLTFSSLGSTCEVHSPEGTRVQYGNPWRILESWMCRYELLDEVDVPFPLGGCFGFWGYDLKQFVEPGLKRHAHQDLDIPDCHVGFYDSLVVYDHHLAKTWIVSTGLTREGTRSEMVAQKRAAFWREILSEEGRFDASSGSQTLAVSPAVLQLVKSGI